MRFGRRKIDFCERGRGTAYCAYYDQRINGKSYLRSGQQCPHTCDYAIKRDSEKEIKLVDDRAGI